MSPKSLTAFISPHGEKSNTMAADIYTKGFVSAQKWAAALGLINVYPKEEQKRMRVKVLREDQL